MRAASAGFTPCPAVTSGPSVTLYQAVTTFSPDVCPDFGAADFPTFELDPGVVGPSLDAAGAPVYASETSTPTTSGEPSRLTSACSCAPPAPPEDLFRASLR